ncbi:MAG: DUF697 domain-containing protein [Sandaracinaceae bacterium]
MFDSLFGSQDERGRRCQRLIENCGYAAAALTLIPIPGSEILGVMPLHVGMVIGIGQEYGVRLTRESATELLLKIGGTVGLSLVGSRIAMTAGKILLPGLGGLVAAPFMFASTLAIGAVARAWFENEGAVTDTDMKRIYDRAKAEAKSAFDPSRARSEEARRQAEAAAREARTEGTGADADAAPAPAPSVDDLAERLAKVEELHEKGMISEAEYKAERRRILDEI